MRYCADVGKGERQAKIMGANSRGWFGTVRPRRVEDLFKCHVYFSCARDIELLSADVLVSECQKDSPLALQDVLRKYDFQLLIPTPAPMSDGRPYEMVTLRNSIPISPLRTLDVLLCKDNSQHSFAG